MSSFSGFPNEKVHQVPIPAPFFEDLMRQIESRDELLITLQVFWLLDQLEGTFRFLRFEDFTSDRDFMRALSEEEKAAKKKLEQGLKQALDRGVLLKAEIELQGKNETCFFLNSPKGRAAVRAISSGQWTPGESVLNSHETFEEPPNIFRLYEENIGLITPILAESLIEAEDTYPPHWIKDAIQIAVERNKRNWRYAEAILKRWQVEGRDAKKEHPKNRPDSAENRRRYVEGEYSDFIEH